MNRISSDAANTVFLNKILQLQERLNERGVQVGSEKKSQNYQGVAIDSRQIITVENERDLLKKYIAKNEHMDVRMQVRETVLEGLHDEIREFRSQLRYFATFEPKDSERTQDIQDAALRSLYNLEDLLNTSVDGRFLFGGAKATTPPVDFGVTTVSAFQSKYDGSRVTVPTTRDAHLAEFSLASDLNNIDKQYITDTNFLQFREEQLYDISFTSSSKTIAAVNKDGTSATGVFSSLAVGNSVTSAGTASNNATFTVASIATDGSSITVTEAVADEFATGGVAFSGDLVLTPGTKTSTIEASSAMFSNVEAGTEIEITNTTNNNGTYTVNSVSSDGRTITINTEMLSDESNVTAPLITYVDPSDPTKTITIDSNTTGTLSFTRSNNTIAAGRSLSALVVGASFTVAGSTHNNGTYTVKSNDGTNLVIESQKLTDEGTTSGNSSAATFFDMFSWTDVRFDTSDDSIEVRRAGTSTAVPDIFENLVVGSQVTITNSDNNNGTYTIASISADKSKITVSENISTTETDSAGVTFAGAGGVSFNYESKSELVFTNVGAAGTDTIHIRDRNDATITTGVFSNLMAGQEFTVSGANGAVNRVYTIKSISANGSTITVDENISATVVEDATEVRMQVFSVDGKVATTDYYAGDGVITSHRVNKDRSFDFDFNAIHPGVEKAVRAMKLILQGEYGSDGGLDQNEERVGQALYLLDSALDRAVPGSPPFGTETDGNLAEARSANGFNRVLISRTLTHHKSLVAFMEANIADLENINPTDTITKLLDDQNSLEASFQVFSRIRQLSLTNFL